VGKLEGMGLSLAEADECFENKSSGEHFTVITNAFFFRGEGKCPRPHTPPLPMPAGAHGHKERTGERRNMIAQSIK